MTIKGEIALPNRSLMLVCLSAAILIMGAQRRAGAEATIEGRETTSITSPAPRGSSQLLKQPSPTSSINNTRLVIKLSDRRVYLYRSEQLQASYPIAVGKAGWETPKGNFKVIQMQRNPAWQHPWNGTIIPSGPNNPLGARWIGFWTDGKNFIGFHGTPNENLIGQAVSHGCIRMRNKDVLALYAQVNVGTPVTVVP